MLSSGTARSLENTLIFFPFKKGVKILKEKSLISETGAFEFAKRFRVRAGTVDLSPVSCRALLTSRMTIGLLCLSDKYKIIQFSTAISKNFHIRLGSPRISHTE